MARYHSRYRGERDVTGFPNPLVPNSEKGYDYIMAYAKAAWNESKLQCPGIFYFNANRYYELQDYAMGTQSITKLKPQMGVEEGDDKSYLNINFRPLAMLSEMRSNALNKLNKVSYNIDVDNLNPLAKAEKSEWYAKQLAKIKIREALTTVMAGKQQVPGLQQDPLEAEDEDELNIMDKYTYRSKRAADMKKLLKFINNNNKMDVNRSLIKKDWYDFGVAGVIDDVDSNGNVIWRRVNPMMVISSQCKEKDFSDAAYIGEVTQYTISALKQLAQSQFSEDQYADIARKTNGINYSQELVGYPPPNYSYPYDNKFINVLDLRFFTTWEKEDRAYLEADPKRRYNPEIPDKYSSSAEDHNYERETFQTVMRTKWIVGTDYMFDYGMDTNIKRSKKSLQNAKLPYHFLALDFNNMQASSRVDKAVTIEDQICLLWLKLQNEISRTVPSGWYLDMDALENAILGGKGGDALTKDEIIEMFVQTGIVVGRSKDYAGRPGNPLPVTSLKNGLSPDVVTYFNLINMNIKMMRQVMGVSDQMDGSSRADRTNSQGVEMMFEASENNLQDIIDAEKNLLERLCNDLIIRAQDVLKHKKIEGYVKSIGDNTVEFISADSTLSYELFGVTIKNKPNDQAKIRLEQMINDAYSKQELDASDIPILEQMDDLNTAYVYFAYKKKKYIEQQRKVAMEKIQMEIQLKNAEIAAQTQGKVAEINAQNEGKFKILQMQKQFDLQIQDKKYQYEMQLHGARNQTDLSKKGIDADTKKQVQQMKHASEMIQQPQQMQPA